MRCGESSAFFFLVRWFLSLHSIKMQFAIRRKNRTAMFINSWSFRRSRLHSSLHSTGCHWCDFNSAWKPFLRFSLHFFAQKHKHSESTRFSTFIERWHQFRCRDKKEFSSFSFFLSRFEMPSFKRKYECNPTVDRRRMSRPVKSVYSRWLLRDLILRS